MARARLFIYPKVETVMKIANWFEILTIALFSAYLTWNLSSDDF
jgi:hypothetical protein